MLLPKNRLCGAVEIDWRKLRKTTKGRKTGIVMTPAAWIPGKGTVSEILLESARVQGFLGLEHGLNGELQAGHQFENYIEQATGLPVYSYFSKGRVYPEEFVAAVDVVAYGVQDVGNSLWSFNYALLQTMICCAKHKKKLVILDLPPPFSYLGSRGPVYAHKSYKGAPPIPFIYNITSGELALYYRDALKLDLNLQVVRLKNWRRGVDYDDTGLPWIPPSANLPTSDSAFCYNVTVLIEGTNLSEGRGTIRPFEYFGAPWLSSTKIVRSLNARKLPGVAFREIHFTPAFSKYKGQNCSGIHLVVLNRRICNPMRVLFELFLTLAREEPRFCFKSETDTVEDMIGSRKLIEVIQKGGDYDELVGTWDAECCGFNDRMESFLLYPALKSGKRKIW
ncbi:MAG: DUF1343 domain-containing protein [Verrucomicrobiae bacterium]|nr:DUF1343 domain-containing protein [Verrucomicrobiae bacterium]